MYCEKSLTEAAKSSYTSHFWFHCLSSGYLYILLAGVNVGVVSTFDGVIIALVASVTLFCFDLLPKQFTVGLTFADVPRLISHPKYVALILVLLCFSWPSTPMLAIAGLVTMFLISPAHRVGIGLLESNFPTNYETRIAVHSLWGLVGYSASPILLGLLLHGANPDQAIGLLLAAALGWVLHTTARTQSARLEHALEELSSKRLPSTSRVQNVCTNVWLHDIALSVHIFCGEFLFWLAHALLFFGAISFSAEAASFESLLVVAVASQLLLCGFVATLIYPAIIGWVKLQAAFIVVVFAIAGAASGHLSNGIALISSAGLFLLVRIPILDRQNLLTSRWAQTPKIGLLRYLTVVSTTLGAVVAVVASDNATVLLLIFSAAAALLALSQLALIVSQAERTGSKKETRC